MSKNLFVPKISYFPITSQSTSPTSNSINSTQYVSYDEGHPSRKCLSETLDSNGSHSIDLHRSNSNQPSFRMSNLLPYNSSRWKAETTDIDFNLKMVPRFGETRHGATFGHQALFLASGRWTRWFLTKESRLSLLVPCLSLSKLFLWIHFFFSFYTSFREMQEGRNVEGKIESKQLAFVNDALICHLPRWR